LSQIFRGGGGGSRWQEDHGSVTSCRLSKRRDNNGG
jgi:hypothetical protein